MHIYGKEDMDHTLMKFDGEVIFGGDASLNGVNPAIRVLRR